MRVAKTRPNWLSIPPDTYCNGSGMFSVLFHLTRLDFLNNFTYVLSFNGPLYCVPGPSADWVPLGFEKLGWKFVRLLCTVWEFLSP